MDSKYLGCIVLDEPSNIHINFGKAKEAKKKWNKKEKL